MPGPAADGNKGMVEVVFGVHAASTVLTVLATESQDEEERILRGASAGGGAGSEKEQLISLSRASAV